MKKTSPCLNCSRTKHPENCENKCCREWASWFLAQWEQIHRFYEVFGGKEHELEK